MTSEEKNPALQAHIRSLIGWKLALCYTKLLTCSYFWQVWTRVFKLMTLDLTLQLDLDFYTSGFWLHLDLSQLTWKHLFAHNFTEDLLVLTWDLTGDFPVRTRDLTQDSPMLTQNLTWDLRLADQQTTPEASIIRFLPNLDYEDSCSPWWEGFGSTLLRFQLLQRPVAQNFFSKVKCIAASAKCNSKP